MNVVSEHQQVVDLIFCILILDANHQFIVSVTDLKLNPPRLVGTTGN